MKTLATTLVLLTSLTGAAAALAPVAHADDGVIVQRTTTRVVHPAYTEHVWRPGPGYHHRYRTVKRTRCWWHNHHKVCRTRWVRVYR